MKILVLYAGKYGCTESCVNYLKDKLKHDVKLKNLKNSGPIHLQEYDWIIVGGSVYMGKIQKEVKQFCMNNLQALLTKHIALFLCCTTPEQADDYFKNNFPPQLLGHAAQTVNFGGELRPDKMSFLDWTVTTLVSKLEPKKYEILYHNIEQLAAAL